MASGSVVSSTTVLVQQQVPSGWHPPCLLAVVGLRRGESEKSEEMERVSMFADSFLRSRSFVSVSKEEREQVSFTVTSPAGWMAEDEEELASAW